MTCVITKKDNVTLPDKSKKVSPCNNFLHSMFESCRIIINDIPISLNPTGNETIDTSAHLKLK